MSRKWLRLVSCLCMVAFFAANTHANMAIAALLHGIGTSRQTPSRADETGKAPSRPYATECQHCAKKTSQTAVTDTDLSEREDCPCGPDCPDCPRGPCGPHCPCPGGCAMCSIAKVPCVPTLLSFSVQPERCETILRSPEHLHVISFRCPLFRPPKV